MILRVVLVLTLAPGTLCQEIMLSPPTLITPCTSKSREGKDRFIFTGTFGKDVPQLVGQGWNNIMYIISNERGGGQYDYYIVCRFVFAGGQCTIEEIDNICSCVYQFKQIHFVLNYTLETYNSEKTFSAYWRHRWIVSSLLLKNYTMPKICDVNTALLTLTIAGVVGPFPRTRSCSFTLTLGTSNLMQLCCSDMAMPCYTQISFRGTVVAADESPCVTYGPTLDGVTGILQLSYSVCTKAEYIPGNNCTVQTGVVTTRVTAPTTGVLTTAADNGVNIPDISGPTTDGYATGTTAPVTAQPTFQKSNTLQILFWAAILLILLVIICALVTLWIILARRREQAARESRRESQRSSLPKAEEVEPAVEEEKLESDESASTVSKIESEV